LDQQQDSKRRGKRFIFLNADGLEFAKIFIKYEVTHLFKKSVLNTGFLK